MIGWIALGFAGIAWAAAFMALGQVARLASVVDAQFKLILAMSDRASHDRRRRE